MFVTRRVSPAVALQGDTEGESAMCFFLSGVSVMVMMAIAGISDAGSYRTSTTTRTRSHHMVLTSESGKKQTETQKSVPRSCPTRPNTDVSDKNAVDNSHGGNELQPDPVSVSGRVGRRQRWS